MAQILRATNLTPEENNKAQRVDALLTAYENPNIPVAESTLAGENWTPTPPGFFRALGKFGNDTDVALQALIDFGKNAWPSRNMSAP